MIYIAYILLLLLLLYFEYIYENIRFIIRILIPCIFSLLIGLRATGVGADTLTYYQHYYTYGEWGCSFVEPGFDFLNRFLYSYGYNANTFFTVISLLSFFFIYLSLKNSKGVYYTIPAFCLYLFPFLFFINGMRQALALSIFFYSISFIKNRRLIPYIFLLLFASLFHASVLMLIPLYFIDKIVLSKRVVYFLYALSFIGLFVNVYSFLPAIEVSNRTYGDYSEGMTQSAASFLGYSVSTSLNIMILILMIKNNIFKNDNVLANLAFIGLLLPNIGFHAPIIGRITIYFSYIVFYIYPNFFVRQRKYLFNNQLLTILLFIVFHSALLINALIEIPYVFYWDDVNM